MPALFHLAFPVHDLAAAKRFYVEGLGCVLGRESSKAVTLGLVGHQLVAHLTTEPTVLQKGIYPRHFGLVLTLEEEWQALADRAPDVLPGRPLSQSSRIQTLPARVGDLRGTRLHGSRGFRIGAVRRF